MQNLGVRLKTIHFTGTEDEQIRENWHEYCEYSGADPIEAPTYMGCANDRSKRKGSKYFRAWMCKPLICNINFFQILGRGMPDRSGIQIYRRCQVIFHPSTLQDGLDHNRPWTKEELQLLASLGPTRRWADIGVRLNRNRSYCQKEYLRLMKNDMITGEEETDDWRLFYSKLVI